MNDFLASITDYYWLVIVCSLLINTVIAVVGVIPTIPLTTFNIAFFGPVNGFFVSLTGEVLGSIVSFLLYRFGFQTMSQNFLNKHNKISKLLNSNAWEQSKLVVSFRLFPYMPSGLITYAAAISNMELKFFVIASTIGKIPAMIIEVVLAEGIVKAAQMGGITAVIIIASLLLLLSIIIKLVKNEK